MELPRWFRLAVVLVVNIGARHRLARVSEQALRLSHVLVVAHRIDAGPAAKVVNVEPFDSRPGASPDPCRADAGVAIRPARLFLQHMADPVAALARRDGGAQGWAPLD